MKRVPFLLIAALFAFSGSADEHSEKRHLVAELLEVMDAKNLLRTSFENFFTTIQMTMDEGRSAADAVQTAEDVDPEYREEWERMRAESEAHRKREEEKQRAFIERMFANVDHVKYFDEVYAPRLMKQFTAEELRLLIAFFKTEHGQKLAASLPDLGLDGAGMKIIYEAGQATDAEMQAEEARKYPWKHTMADLRTLATALEARATDVNEYPKADFDDLEPLLTPTYLRKMPKVDSWGTAFLYVSDGQNYRFVSAGADKRFEWSSKMIDLTIVEPKFSESADADIVFQNGNFIQSPKRND